MVRFIASTFLNWVLPGVRDPWLISYHSCFYCCCGGTIVVMCRILSELNLSMGSCNVFFGGGVAG